MEHVSINWDEQIYVKNISDGNIYFKQKEFPFSDVKMKPQEPVRMKRGEVRAQIESGNTLFIGEDKEGKHARIYIEDEAMRVYAGFDSEDGKKKQDILTIEKIKKILEKPTTSFQKELDKHVRTQWEINLVKKYLTDSKFNEADKLNIFEAHFNKRKYH